MSRRAELYRVVRDLRKYLSWQQASGAAGSVAASAHEREAFEAKKEARQKAKLERLTSSLRVGADSGGPARGAQTPKPQAPSQPSPSQPSPSQPSPSQPSPSQPDSSQSNQVAPADSGPKSFNPFGDKKKEVAKSPDGGVGPSGSAATPWKTGVGSRPTPRFDGRNKPEASSGQSPNQNQQNNPQNKRSKPNKKAPDNNKNKQKQAPMSSNDNSPPPVDYDAYYPEASGMVEAGGFDPSREPVEATSATPPKKAPAKAKPAQRSKSKELSKSEKLEFLQKYMGDCKRCGLCESRTNIAFGVGDPQAKLVFVGEAPGYNEDQQGEPFVGKAGQLLDKMIVAMGLAREDVYICNVIKCRPPDNRDPHVDEIKECAPFLRKQLEAIEPTVIVTLGKFASQFLTGQEKAMGAMRGRWHDWEGVPVMPTYHPAYLLRSEDQKGKTWSDLQMVMERLGL